MEIPQFDGSVVEMPIWLEMSNDKDVKSPYGDNTYGYLAVAYNPDTVMHFGDEDSETILNAFMVTMPVKGVSADKETGKNYLMLDGGEGDTEMMEKSVEELGKNYHEYVSDIDYLKNLNFSDFVINLENNLLKRKK